MMRPLLAAMLLSTAFACSGDREDALTLKPTDDGDEDSAPQADADTPNPSLCTVANLALCDGFELQQVTSPPWFFVTKAASVTLDDTRSYRGGQSLHVQTDAGPDIDVRQGELTEVIVVPQPTLYARVFMYVASPIPDWQFRLLGVLQEDAPNAGPSLCVDQGRWLLASGADSVASATSLPLDRWMCLEWEVVSATDGSMRFWLDGEELTDLAYAGDTTRSPAVGRFSAGVALFGNIETLPAIDVWIDELGLDSARIGCSR